MRIRVTLLLKKSKVRSNGKYPVYARCVMDGRRIELSTSILVDMNDWDKSRQEIAGNSKEIGILNNRLLKFVSGIYDIYNQLEAGMNSFDVYCVCRVICWVNSCIECFSAKSLSGFYELVGKSGIFLHRFFIKF